MKIQAKLTFKSVRQLQRVNMAKVDPISVDIDYCLQVLSQYKNHLVAHVKQHKQILHVILQGYLCDVFI